MASHPGVPPGDTTKPCHFHGPGVPWFVPEWRHAEPSFYQFSVTPGRPPRKAALVADQALAWVTVAHSAWYRRDRAWMRRPTNLRMPGRRDQRSAARPGRTQVQAPRMRRRLCSTRAWQSGAHVHGGGGPHWALAADKAASAPHEGACSPALATFVLAAVPVCCGCAARLWGAQCERPCTLTWCLGAVSCAACGRTAATPTATGQTSSAASSPSRPCPSASTATAAAAVSSRTAPTRGTGA